MFWSFVMDMKTLLSALRSLHRPNRKKTPLDGIHKIGVYYAIIIFHQVCQLPTQKYFFRLFSNSEGNVFFGQWLMKIVKVCLSLASHMPTIDKVPSSNITCWRRAPQWCAKLGVLIYSTRRVWNCVVAQNTIDNHKKRWFTKRY